MGLAFIRYNEIGLKGRNRIFFEKRLIRNIKIALNRVEGCEELKIRRFHGRLLLENLEWNRLVEKRLSCVFGIASFSPVFLAERSIESMKKLALEEFSNELKDKETFCVRARRNDKSFELNSMQIEYELGGFLKSNFEGLKVSINFPQTVVGVEVRKSGCYLYSRIIQGPGGLPVGSNSRGLVLISGGIDSPVAAHLVHKRGMYTSFCYFHSSPHTGEDSLNKVRTLVGKVGETLGRQRLYIVNYTPIQEAIRDNCQERFRTVLYRRMMMRVANRIARIERTRILVTGDNIGQVASQTVENMYAINNAAAGCLVMRPLLAFDKKEIIEIAKELGTFETSVLPYPDSCTVFMPQNPVTKATVESLEEEEKNLPIEELIEAAVGEVVMEEI